MLKRLEILHIAILWIGLRRHVMIIHTIIQSVVLDCLEAGLECYRDDGDEEGCRILEDLIELFNKKEE